MEYFYLCQFQDLTVKFSHLQIRLKTKWMKFSTHHLLGSTHEDITQERIGVEFLGDEAKVVWMTDSLEGIQIAVITNHTGNPTTINSLVLYSAFLFKPLFLQCKGMSDQIIILIVADR